MVQPLESSKRNIEEEMIQINIQREEIASQNDLLKLEKQKLSEFNQNNEKSTDIKNRNLSSIRSEIDTLKIEIDLLSKTKLRLNNEQLRLEKDLSRCESRKEALNETRGSYALRILSVSYTHLTLPTIYSV